MRGFWLLISMKGSETLVKMGEGRGSGVLEVLFSSCGVVEMVSGVFMDLDGSGVDVLGSISSIGMSTGSQDGVCAVDSCPWSSDGSGWCISEVWVYVWLCVVVTGLCLFV